MAVIKNIIREKETFRYEVMLNIDGHDTRIYVKANINFEKLTFKVTPTITLRHGWGKDVKDEFLAGIAACRERCEEMLAAYRNEYNIGDQQDLFVPGGEAATD